MVIEDDWNGAKSQAAIVAAHKVLKHWGLDVETPVAPVAPVPTALLWPPVDGAGRPYTITLPDVYRENYYHVLNESRGLVEPGEALVLHRSYWNEEDLQWRMQFRTANNQWFWVGHTHVKPGDEIDSAAQARSNP